MYFLGAAVGIGFHVVYTRDYFEMLILILLIPPPKSWDDMSYHVANVVQLKTEKY